MSVTPEKQKQLIERMERLGIRETDLEEKFLLGSGRGGQAIHKTSSCVYLKHLPTAIEVKCQADRSRALNRFLARRALCDKLEELQGKPTLRTQEAAKRRKQKERRARRRKSCSD